MTDLNPVDAMPTLSLAARAVWEAFRQFDEAGMHVDYDVKIAAALRAAADQVVPTEMDPPPIAPDLGHFRQHERRLTRQRLLAIAAELENNA